eukprot:TRINITY_DN8705_c0_g1_i2.p1 TRINITY_DN8705_c0_g1~~TRINITY_DN8705_c0_g1_i2.p1  ORF type:complete len:194 (+),score=15.76 TRINITY_DN8705_c0_g1_i2:255-836(+)
MNDDRKTSDIGARMESGGRLYNPYADLYPSLDPKSMEGLYRLPTVPEYVFSEEAATHRRSFGDNLTFFTGCGYLIGAVAGGSFGLVEGVRLQEPGDTWKLRVNRVLNATGHRGRAAGNAMGVLGLLYGGLDGLAYNFRGKDDILNSIGAGLATGALYKAAAGPRSAAIAGALGGIAAAALSAGRHVSKRYLAF